MNYFKHVCVFHKMPCKLQVRNISACINTRQDKEMKYLNSSIRSPYLSCRRQLSLEGFTKWQEGVYTSISNSYPVHLMQDGLLYIHDTTGLPWWATVVTSTILIRSVMTLPLSVYSLYILAKVENISLELKDLIVDLKRETAIYKRYWKISEKQAAVMYKRSLKKQWVKLIERDNCHPFKASLVVWFQIPVWVCMSFALRNLVYMTGGDPAAAVTFLEMSTGGIGWIPNLTEPDLSWILPVAFGLTNLIIIELQRMSKLRQPSKMYNVLTNVFRGFSIIMIPVAASVPSCMSLYWMTSSSYGLIQNMVLLSPSVRRKLKVPEAPSEIEQPYNHIKQEISHTLNKLLPKKTE